jgi:hypothetical protein
VIVVTATMRAPRSRGAVSGTLLVLLGVWGALIPFVGPYFDYAYTPDNAWDYTRGRLLLEVLPGAAVALGGLFVLGSANRVAAGFGAWLAALGGAWFVLGVPLATITDGPAVGEPIGGTTRQFLEYLGFFGGLGVVVVFLAAFAMGRFAVVGVREVERAADSEEAEEESASATTTEPPPTTPDRDREPATASRWQRLRAGRSKHTTESEPVARR